MPAVAKSEPSLPLPFLCLLPSSDGSSIGKRRLRRSSASSRSESFVNAWTNRGGLDGGGRHGERALELV
jgi:hypothetical protein